MRRARLILAALSAAVLAAPSTALAGGSPVVGIGAFSSQLSTASARVGGEITASPGASASTAAHASGAAEPGAAPAEPPPPPTLEADSPLLATAHPAGSGSFWYQAAPGEDCIYAPGASPACFLVVSAAPSTPPRDVSATAASIAGELGLSLGAIEASPSAARSGLTGAVSWFWLTTAPSARTLTLSLAGERYRLSATPGSVSWSFGDGAGLSGGAGVPFAAGAPPADAITHVYASRCLPGDDGAGPGVPPGCGPGGYTVRAALSWTVSYRASGPITQAGQLATRTTAAQLVYPVSEVRAFLVGGQA